MRRFVTGGSDGVVKIWDYKYAHLRYYILLSPLPRNRRADVNHAQRTRKNLLSHHGTHRPQRLGPRCSLGPDHAPKILHSLRGARQDGQDMDQRPRAPERLETDNLKLRRRLMEGELEPERERTGCQWWR